MFRRDPNGVWAQEAELVPDDVQYGDQIGISASIYEGIAVIGSGFAKGEDGDLRSAGAAYLFRRETNGAWLQEAKLTPTDAQAFDFFGWSVSVSNDTVLIGAYGEDGPNDQISAAGAAYVFE